MYESISIGFALFVVAQATHECFVTVDDDLYVKNYPETPKPDCFPTGTTHEVMYAPSNTGRYDNNVAFVSLGLLSCGSDADIFSWEANYYCGDEMYDFGRPTGEAFTAEMYFLRSATQKEAYIFCFSNDNTGNLSVCAWTRGDTYLTFVASTKNLPSQDGPFDLEIVTKTLVLENEQSDELQAGIGPEFGHLYSNYGGQYVWKIWHYDDESYEYYWFNQGYYDVYVMQLDGDGGTYSFSDSVYADYPFYYDGAAKMVSVAIATSSLLYGLI